jgi:hypothetical protein
MPEASMTIFGLPRPLNDSPSSAPPAPPVMAWIKRLVPAGAVSEVVSGA